MAGMNNVACIACWMMFSFIINLDEATLPEWLVRNVKIFMFPFQKVCKLVKNYGSREREILLMAMGHQGIYSL